MKYLIFSLFIYVPIISGSFNVSQICELLPNETKFQDPYNCSQWYSCINGVPSDPTACLNGAFFDKKTQRCVTKSQAMCNQDLCATQTSGIFIADPTSCNSYFYCSRGFSQKGICSNGYNFDPFNGICGNYTCTNTTLDYEQLCLLIPDNIFIADVENCQGWYTCKKNTPSKGKCTPGYLFDPITGSCDFTGNVACGARNAENISTVQTPKSSGNCDFPGRYISDNKTCNGYYFCFDDGFNGNILLSGECSSGFFDASNGGSCANRTQVDCLYDRCVGNVKWTSVRNTDCKAYHLCANNYTGYCPEEFPYFDEVTQQCVKTKITYPSCV